jgi:hypothetical protein
MLYPIKVLYAFPSLILPSPFVSFEGQYKWNYHPPQKGHKEQEGPPHIIAYTPYPCQQESAPIPSAQPGGNGRFAAHARSIFRCC